MDLPAISFSLRSLCFFQALFPAELLLVDLHHAALPAQQQRQRRAHQSLEDLEGELRDGVGRRAVDIGAPQRVADNGDHQPGGSPDDGGGHRLLLLPAPCIPAPQRAFPTRCPLAQALHLPAAASATGPSPAEAAPRRHPPRLLPSFVPKAEAVPAALRNAMPISRRPPAAPPRKAAPVGAPKSLKAGGVPFPAPG